MIKLKEIISSNVFQQVEKEFNDKYPSKDKHGIVIELRTSSILPNFAELHSIVVPKDLRGRGIGSEIMNKVIEWADEKHSIIGLTPSTDFGASSVNRLKRFYKQFGFIENKGRNRDFTISNSMYRIPRSA